MRSKNDKIFIATYNANYQYDGSFKETIFVGSFDKTLTAISQYYIDNVDLWDDVASDCHVYMLLELYYFNKSMNSNIFLLGPSETMLYSKLGNEPFKSFDDNFKDFCELAI